MQSLATKYRPIKFEDVCSQQSIITILKRQLELKQLKNCYLFCGASGCGKTTIARIFANEINNYIGMPIEIDGASNNSVENVRQIINSATERAIDGKYKIYIIDECHALSAQAWQAFLKCIEEPPEYTIFIFCTTDPQKIPNTILNRVMRFNFTRINTDVIKTRLNYICEQENFINYQDSLEYISKLAMGCMRDAISLLDKCASYSTDLCIENVEAALGTFSYSIMFHLANSIRQHDEANAIAIINFLYKQGNDLVLFISQFLTFCLDIEKYILFKKLDMTNLPNTELTEVINITGFNNASEYYVQLINKILECKNMLKYDNAIKSTIEACILNMCRDIKY